MRIKDLFAVVCTVTALALSCKKDEKPEIIPVSGISLDVTVLELTPGDTRSLVATVVPSNATNKNVNWSSSNSSVAVVEQNGRVTAVKTGTATIIATTVDGGKTATCELTVTAGTKFVNIPDEVFKEYCIKNFDTDHDGKISFEEAESVSRIEVNTDAIYSLEGIECFTNLEVLNCGGSWHSEDGKAVFDGQLTNLNLNNNIKLVSLYCGHNQISELDVSKLVSLTDFNCEGNKLTVLDITENTELRSYVCQENFLTSIDVANNVLITFLCCKHNKLTNLDISKNVELNMLECNDNMFQVLDVSNNLKLSVLDSRESPQLTEIWLKEGQTIEEFNYDTGVATIKYK